MLALCRLSSAGNAAHRSPVTPSSVQRGRKAFCAAKQRKWRKDPKNSLPGLILYCRLAGVMQRSGAACRLRCDARLVFPKVTPCSPEGRGQRGGPVDHLVLVQSRRNAAALKSGRFRGGPHRRGAASIQTGSLMPIVEGRSSPPADDRVARLAEVFARKESARPSTESGAEARHQCKDLDSTALLLAATVTQRCWRWTD